MQLQVLFYPFIIPSSPLPTAHTHTWSYLFLVARGLWLLAIERAQSLPCPFSSARQGFGAWCCLLGEGRTDGENLAAGAGRAVDLRHLQISFW